MVSKSQQSSPRKSSTIHWFVGIPVSLLVLVLFVWFVQPWGKPRESITSTAPKDGDFYDPNTDQASVESSESENLSVSENEQQATGSVQIVDVNLASWKPIDEQSVAEDELPSRIAEVEERVLVELSSTLWSKSVGELVQFSIPQMEDVLVGSVTKVDVINSHTRILGGKLEDGGKEFTFLLIADEANAYAHINTSTGSYKLVGTPQYGWLMDSEKILPGVDFSLPEHFTIDADPNGGELEPESPPDDEE